MSATKKKTERLTFFCQLCDKSINSNICPTHGIDFVTIKKVSESVLAAQQAEDEARRKAREAQEAKNRRINGMLQLEQHSTSTDPNSETRLALASDAEDETDEAFLPVLPTDETSAQGLDTFEDQPAEEAMDDADYRGDDFQQPSYEYEDIEAEPEPDYYQDDASQNYYYTPPAARKSNKGMIIGLLSVLVLVALGVAYFAMNQSTSPTALYSEAEKYFHQQDYAAALATYHQFVEEYPNDALTPMVNRKIKQIRQLQNTGAAVDLEEHQEAFKDWMLKANIAFQKQQYVEPAEDNVNYYLEQVLKIDPANEPALTLQAKVIAAFEQEAEAALSNRDYESAISAYRNILVFTPNDTEVMSKIHDLLNVERESSN
ncbi:MAG: hypothetical protein KDH97_18800 [Calditrichaeota bacterium]|nr:hypothetical protein [Calditrichota bacterium]